jgi:dTDP-D-glucose 4,6-dehydratase
MFGLETVRLRYFNVFGPRQMSAGGGPPVIVEILRAMLQGRRPIVEGNGQEPRHFIYVDDVVYGNLLAAEAPRLSGKVYNIAQGRPCTIDEVVATINALLNTDLQPCYTKERADARGSLLADIARAEVEFGFCPSTDLQQGLRRCIEYYRTRRQELIEHQGQHSPLEKGPHLRNGNPDPIVSVESRRNASLAASVECAMVNTESDSNAGPNKRENGEVKTRSVTRAPCSQVPVNHR